MPTITLPDGTKRQFQGAISVSDVAKDIAPSLAKATLAGKIDDKLVDTSAMIDKDVKLTLLTEKDDMALDIIRHSSAHLLAQAVKRCFPEAQITIGPVIEEGFYYDIAYHRPFTPEDLQIIEKQMQRIVKENLPITREQWSREEAIAYFEGIGEHYKAQIIRDIDSSEPLSVYRQGDFIDLCRGPHVPSTGKLKVFKLTKLAGAYWRGDANNEMLQRIYGTAWTNKQDLADYLHRLAEAKKRDHRKLGKKLGLFHLQDDAVGMIFWHAKGWAIWQVLEQYIRDNCKRWGYQEIRTPQVIDRSLWEKSGHWEKFRDDMFTTESEKRDYAIKPMSCPAHIQIFNQGLHSYRDLPIRYAEFGCCHRNEASGALHGLMRVRQMTQDDGHIFLTFEQVPSEASYFIQQVFELYRDFGFNDILIKLSTRPDKRIGSDEVWDKAEACLEKALDSNDIPWTLNKGEGAFYGPKIEFSLKDCLGRVWQCGTLQVDFSMPDRLGASYIDENSTRQVPVMLHRAALGSMERFIGILIEHYAGRFPVWLAPVQAVILNISDKQLDYANTVYQILLKEGFRLKKDLRNESIGFKIREHTLQRVPYLLVIGDKEVASKQLAVRNTEGKDFGAMPISSFITMLKQAIAKKGQQSS